MKTDLRVLRTSGEDADAVSAQPDAGAAFGLFLPRCCALSVMRQLSCATAANGAPCSHRRCRA